MRAFETSLKNLMEVRENIPLQFGSSSDTATATIQKDQQKKIGFAATSDPISVLEAQCPLKDKNTKIGIEVRSTKRIFFNARKSRKTATCLILVWPLHIGQAKAKPKQRVAKAEAAKFTTNGNS